MNADSNGIYLNIVCDGAEHSHPQSDQHGVGYHGK